VIRYDYKKNLEKFSIFYSFIAIGHDKIPDFFVLIFVVVAGHPQKLDENAALSLPCKALH
jgi:hypothetical protein